MNLRIGMPRSSGGAADPCIDVRGGTDTQRGDLRSGTPSDASRRDEDQRAGAQADVSRRREDPCIEACGGADLQHEDLSSGTPADVTHRREKPHAGVSTDGNCQREDPCVNPRGGADLQHEDLHSGTPANSNQRREDQYTGARADASRQREDDNRDGGGAAFPRTSRNKRRKRSRKGQCSTTETERPTEPETVRSPNGSPNVNVIATPSGPMAQEAWTEVERKRRAKQGDRTKSKPLTVQNTAGGSKRKKQAPLEKIILTPILEKPAEGEGKRPFSYAAVIKGLHQKVGSSVGFCTIRRTSRDEMILSLPRGGSGSSELRDAIAGVAGPTIRVRHSVPKRTAVVRDLYEGIERADVADAFCRALNGKDPKQVEVTELRPAYGGTFACTVVMPWCTESEKLIREGRIQIGLVRCRVRDRVEVRRCFQCQGFGHEARTCRAEDRSKSCRRCWEKGHKAGSCVAPVKCQLCEEAGHKAAHWSGSSECAAFRTALKSATARNG